MVKSSVSSKTKDTDGGTQKNYEGHPQQTQKERVRKKRSDRLTVNKESDASALRAEIMCKQQQRNSAAPGAQTIAATLKGEERSVIDSVTFNFDGAWNPRVATALNVTMRDTVGKIRTLEGGGYIRVW